MISTLSDMGITEIRLSRLVQSLANSEGLLTRELDLAAGAWDENIALGKEASTRFNTTESRVQMLDNRMTNLKTTIGNELTPAYNMLIDVLSDAVGGVDEFLQNNEAAVPILMGMVGAITAYVGATAAVAGAEAVKNVAIKAGILVLKEAETQTYALNTAMLANPAVLVTAAIVGLVAALGPLIAKSMEASTEAQALSTSMKETRQASQDAQKTFEKQQTTTKANAQVAKNLASSLEDLAKKSKRSTTEQLQLEKGVARLNDLYPELGITVENAAEKINELNSGMHDSLGVVDEVEAKVERYNELMEDNAKLAAQNAESQALLSERLAALTDDERALYDQLVEMAENKGSIEFMDSLSLAYVGAGENIRTLVNDTVALNGEIEANSQQISDNEALMQRYKEEVAAVDTAYETLGEAANSLTEDERNHYNEVVSQIQTCQKQLDALEEEYAEAKEAALEMVHDTINGWKEVKRNSEVTTESIISGYKSQITFMDDYMADKNSLLSRDIDGLAEWVRAHDNASEDSAGAFRALAEASDEEVEQMLSAYQESEKGQESMAGSMASLATEYDTRFLEIVNSAKTAASQLNQNGPAYMSARQTMQGFIDGADSMASRVSARYYAVGRSAIDALKRATRQASPSKEAAEVGVNIGKGLVVGGDKEKRDVENAYEGLGRAAIDAMAMPAIPQSVFNNSSPVNNINRSVSMSMPVTINAQRVTDAEARRLVGIVSKSFATATGGRMS